LSKNAYKAAMEQVKFSDEFEEKAASAMKRKVWQQRRKCQISKLACGGIGAAVCVALALLTVPLLNRPETEVSRQPTWGTAAAPATKTADDNPQTKPEERRVVTSANYGGDMADSYKRPDPGALVICNEVMSALNDAANADAYFFVNIHIISPEQYTNNIWEYIYNGRSLTEWSVLVDLSNDTYPYSEYNGDHGGNITREQWEQAREEAKKLNAQENYDAAVRQYQAEIEPELEKAQKNREGSELERLKRLGYDVFLTDTWEYYETNAKKQFTVFAGILSKTQLLEFDTDPECGYLIDWVTNGDGIVNWQG